MKSSLIIDKLYSMAIKCVCGLLIAIYGYLFIANVLGTTRFDMNNRGYRENAIYGLNWEIIPIVVLMIGIYLLAKKFKVEQWLEKISVKKLMIYTYLVMVVISLVWLVIAQTLPTGDQLSVCRGAFKFIRGNYEFLEPHRYYYIYPFQLGITLFIELVFRVFGVGNYLAVMLFNCFFIAGIYRSLHWFVCKWTKSNKTINLFSIVMMFCLPLCFYSFFVYGTIIGMWALLIGAKYLYKFYLFNEKAIWKRSLFFIVGFAGLSLAVICKNNYSIGIIAVIIVLCISAIKDRRWGCMALSIMLLLSIMTPSLVLMHYEQRSNMKISDGMPKIMWVAMGLHEGTVKHGCGANGWYDAYNYVTYEKAKENSEKSAEFAKKDIKKSINRFKNKPGTIVPFFNEKLVSQWCEPTFQTFWMVTVNEKSNESKGIRKFFVYGIGSKVIKIFMRIYLILVMLGNLVFFITSLKEKDLKVFLFGIMIIGGFLFHMIWEAKSLYILPYFVVSIPMAAIGLARFLKMIRR